MKMKIMSVLVMGLTLGWGAATNAHAVCGSQDVKFEGYQVNRWPEFVYENANTYREAFSVLDVVKMEYSVTVLGVAMATVERDVHTASGRIWECDDSACPAGTVLIPGPEMVTSNGIPVSQDNVLLCRGDNYVDRWVTAPVQKCNEENMDGFQQIKAEVVAPDPDVVTTYYKAATRDEFCYTTREKTAEEKAASQQNSAENGESQQSDDGPKYDKLIDDINGRIQQAQSESK